MPVSGQGAPADEALRQDAIAWLVKVQGEPDVEIDQAFQDWYAADPAHAAAFEAVLAGWDLTGRAAQTPLGQEQRRLAKYTRRRDVRRLLMVAASVVLGLAVFTGFEMNWFSTNWTSPARQERLTSRSGERRTVTLPDGSRVTLDADSMLAIQFTDRERRLTLEKGRARFDVAHDPDHPFIVSAGSREVIAHGTLFDVDLRARHLAVSLLRGSIEVRKAGDVEAGQPVDAAPPGQFLAPGQQVLFERGDDTPAPIALPAQAADWTTRMLSFDDQPLSDVVAQANRDAGPRIILADPRLGGLRYTGTLAAGDSVSLARMLAASFDLTVLHGEHGALILAARNSSKKVQG